VKNHRLPRLEGNPKAAGRFRVAVLCDFAEERWPSMDVVGAMLAEYLQRDHSSTLQAVKIKPRFMRRFSRLGASCQLTANADRLLNRMLDYPRYLRRILNDFDLFHIIDHSYSHLVHQLPAGRVAVTCHDLQTFSCLLEPAREPRSWVFRLMTERILNGLQKACRISCVSENTRMELLHHRLVRPEQAVLIPNGVAPVYSSRPEICGDGAAAQLLGPSEPSIELLNVGSTVPRKRVDVLLHVFAAAHKHYPNLRLIRVGGLLTAQQADLARSLGIRSALVELPFLPDRTLAAVYRRAALVLCPSEAEGFGLPMLESMACGTPVLASDLAPLREVGSSAVHYEPVGQVRQWTAAVLDLLGERRGNHGLWGQRRQSCVERAQNFSWRKTAVLTVELYRNLMS
jgi:glycosyltransferase involved in cell wall biosynthesis